jgi:nucleoside 2-deoxyribosyltransferase
MDLFAFVLMPFAREFNARYKAIERATDAVGMGVSRVDKQSFHRKGITERIIQQIMDADILIADVSTNNPNVLYEVGYAHARDKLCVLLTTDTTTIPFNLKNKQHVVFSNPRDLEKKLTAELQALCAEVDLTFNKNDPECFAVVAVGIAQQIVQSQATSIRLKVQPGSELHVKNVTAHLVKIQRRTRSNKWKQFNLEHPIQLTWTGNTGVTEILSAARYLNVLHIEHNENKLSIWGVRMPDGLANFWSANGAYRLTVSVMGRKTRLDISWKGHWDSINVDMVRHLIPGSAYLKS